MPGTSPRIESPAMQRRVIALIMAGVLAAVLGAAYGISSTHEPQRESQREPEYLGPLRPVSVGAFELGVPATWERSETLEAEPAYASYSQAQVYQAPDEPRRYLAMIPLQSTQRASAVRLLEAMQPRLLGPMPYQEQIPLSGVDPRLSVQGQWAQWAGVRQLQDGTWELHMMAVLGWRGRQFVLIHYRDYVESVEQVEPWLAWNLQLLQRIRQTAQLQPAGEPVR